MTFTGAKMALFLGDRLVTLLRDDTPGLPWAGMWDLPGGGREGDESPLACACREAREEVGIDPTGTAPLWQGQFPSNSRPDAVAWFFLVRMPATLTPVLGDEGQEVRLMAPDAFLDHPRAIGFLKDRLRAALAGLAAP